MENENATDNQNETGTYPASYANVYHMGNAQDSKNIDNGTATNVTFTTGNIANAGSFNGTSSKIALSTLSNIDGDTFSISLWGQQLVDTTNAFAFGSGIEGDDEVRIWAWGSGVAKGWTGTIHNIILPTESEDADLHHLMLTNKAGEQKFYVDGIVVDSDTQTEVGNFSDAHIGSKYSGVLNWFNGLIDETKIINSYLSQDEVDLIYNSESQTLLSFGTQEDVTNDYSVTAGFNWTINISLGTISLFDQSTDQNVTINDWNWLVDGTTTLLDNANLQNPILDANQNTDYNVCLSAGGLGIDGNNYSDSICQTISSGKWYQEFNLRFYDETNADLNGVTFTVSPSIDGNSGYTLTDNNLFIELQPIITPATYTFTLTKSGYTTKVLEFDLNRLVAVDYNFVFISTTNTTSVNFQVFNESGTTANNTTFFVFDFDVNKYVDIETTDSLGRMTVNLNETSSDYNFFSDEFNFGTTTWTITKPKDAITLVDITGNWKYSITGASYSSGTNIVASVQKLLLQNTVNPYYMQIQDVNETYAPSNFGLQSITTEGDKNLNPYLYLYSQADLKLIKLLRYSTNIPISEPYELDLSVYTDSNGLIPIGTFINDSTGTYNIYMDSNAHYRLEIGSETFELSPTLGVYYVYLSQDIGIEITIQFRH